MSDSTILLRVRQIIREGDDAKTFVFERPDGKPLIYKAGQFLTFIIELHGREVRRSYSMSSAPDVDRYAAITVKRVPNGEISRFWIDLVQEGDIFITLFPSGRFVLDELPPTEHDIVLIGAGSGITPLFSILKQSLTTYTKTHITLIYASRNIKNTLFWHEILKWQHGFPARFNVVHIHSQPSDDWNGIRGRINNTRLEQLVLNSLKFEKTQARFFICGPFDLMRS